MESILTNISQYIQFNETEGEAFLSIVKFRKLKRKETLLTQGQVCDFVTFIKIGCLRYYYLTDGNDSTGQFFFENGWYSDYESFLSGRPSKQNIEALEDCDLYYFYKKDLEQIYKEYPVFEKFGRLMAEKAVVGMINKNENLAILTYEERYLKLVRERPKVIERVSLKYIASFLGMKPESLSRIRTRILNNEKS